MSGSKLIEDELKILRGLLKDRTADLEKAERSMVELTEACGRLREKIVVLERDQKALTRGYVALMGDAALTATT